MQFASMLRTALVALALPTALAAQTSFVSSRGDMSGTTLNWITMYGAPFTPVSAAPTATGVPGLSVESTSPSFLEVRQQPNSWAGNFSSGDPVLFGGSTMSFLFNMDIFGMGANIQGNSYGTFNGTISAYDAANVLLGSYVLSGNSTSADDGSALFLGLRSDVGIRRVTFESFSPESNLEEFGINQAVIETLPQTSVPEPGTYLLVASGLAAVAAVKRRRRV